MEILKHGWKWKYDNKITECKHCGCEFKYDEIEDYTTPHIVNDEGEVLAVWKHKGVQCPECGHWVEVIMEWGS